VKTKKNKSPSIEDRLRAFLVSEAESRTDEHQSAFYRWQEKQLTSVTIAATDEIPEMENLDEFVKSDPKFARSQCYANASRLVLPGVHDLSEDIRYVEGYVVDEGFVCGHAWNSYKGCNFDLTLKLLDDEFGKQKSKKSERSYFRVVEFTQAVTVGYDFKFDGPLQVAHFLKQHKLSMSTFPDMDSVVVRRDYLP
jgi:hypothetical protein